MYKKLSLIICGFGLLLGGNCYALTHLTLNGHGDSTDAANHSLMLGLQGVALHSFESHQKSLVRELQHKLWQYKNTASNKPTEENISRYIELKVKVINILDGVNHQLMKLVFENSSEKFMANKYLISIVDTATEACKKQSGSETCKAALKKLKNYRARR